MYVKRLELIGFKSFADRTVLEVSPGVTAVVGPNGSGKSNIADAMRWVLGEQSIKALRGNKMEDVIFAGSDARKSVNFAEIKLLLDNSDGTLPLDYSEVAVTRRVYRSGESEFYINQSLCRLKDITELFMDTGMGREAYSVIGQGRIEEILSTKPEDRRGVFEEAAGIVKFKVRKREAEKKLLEADQNLLRVHDLLTELNSQLLPMEERASVAKEYQAVLTKAELLSAQVLTAEFEALLEKNSVLLHQAAGIENELQEVIQKESASEQELTDLRSEVEVSERIVQGMQENLLDVTAKVEKNQGDLRVHSERFANVELQSANALATKERLESESVKIHSEIAEQSTKLLELESYSSELKAELSRRQDLQRGKYRMKELRQQLSDTRSGLIEYMRKQAADRNELRNVEIQIAQSQKRLEQMNEDKVQSQMEMKHFEEDHQGTHAQRQALRQDVSRVENERNLCVSEWQAEREKWSLGQQQLDVLEKSYVEQVSRHRALDNMRSARQGFANGPKAVLNAAKSGKLPGIIGAVADLIRVDKAYEVAIETALGGSMQNVVTEHEESARKAILHLKNNNLGRATFLPLSALSARKVPTGDVGLVERLQGWVGIAADLVDIEDSALAVKNFLLGQVLVVKNLEAANTVAAHLKYRYRVVTLDGDVVHPGGSMTGGSQSNRGSGLLAMNREIEQLETALVQSKSLLDKKRDEVSLLQDKEQNLQNLRIQLDNRWSELDKALRDLDNKWHLVELSYTKQLESYQVIENDRLRLEQETVHAIQGKEKLVTVLNGLEESVREAEQSIADIENQIAMEESRQAESQDEWTEWRVKLAESEEAMRSVELVLKRLHKEQESNTEELNLNERGVTQSIERLQELTEDRVRLEEERDELIRLLKSTEIKLKIEQENRHERMRVFNQYEEKVHTLRSTRRQLETRFNDKQIEIGKVSVELETKGNDIREKHGLGIELARQRFALEVSLSVAKQTLFDLRRELTKFGNVNLGDIQEYERLSERFSYLSVQEGDLQSAQMKLRELISEMEEEMGKRFEETFKQVKQQFQEVFQTLFGGGRADLRLSGDGDLLNDGIDILAEPPGKKLQILTLLSGGERALTALALLFAILRVKPVPFCVLDEVEAALDEVNVARFAGFLKQFSSLTQFVIITHRRGTMEAADVLYGVTMQDSGVSKLVSVRVLEEDTATA